MMTTTSTSALKRIWPFLCAIIHTDRDLSVEGTNGPLVQLGIARSHNNAKKKKKKKKKNEKKCRFTAAAKE